MLLAAVFLMAAVVTAFAFGSNSSIVNRTGVSKMDKTFASAAARGLMRDVLLAQLATQRAQAQDVRRFAEALFQRRVEARARLYRLARNSRLILPKRMNAEQRRQLHQLQQLSGREFDRRFLSLIADADFPNLFQFEIRSGALRVDPEVERYAREQLSILRRDMQKARSLADAYG